MNIYQLKNLIQELKQNPIENADLIEFYEVKEEELLRDINILIKKRLEDLEGQTGIIINN
tara:strand:+ start:999 stop:1178 length:180 start_codon:yes stop_codon:yes gene_type:complete